MDGIHGKFCAIFGESDYHLQAKKTNILDKHFTQNPHQVCNRKVHVLCVRYMQQKDEYKLVFGECISDAKQQTSDYVIFNHLEIQKIIQIMHDCGVSSHLPLVWVDLENILHQSRVSAVSWEALNTKSRVLEAWYLQLEELSLN